MKGILGRKVGMTSLFTEHGRSLPVSVIEVKDNVVTQVFTKEKDGYQAVQLATGDKRDKVTTKPLLGHFKKAGTNGKYFVKEVRNMEGFNLGDKLNASIFKAGELVDVTGTSKGKGFQGNIKRHNQSIGPKSHGGGGGSQPVRQVGSIGDVVSNKVNKGMTMPGQMGNKQITVQNLEIVAIDLENNAIMVRGSIPGPNKGFVVIRQAVKGLESKDAQNLVDVKESQEKNALLEEAKKVGADINTNMSLEEMKSKLEEAAAAKAAEKAKEEAKGGE
ncbi:MAG: 50S ribosomal protein L3 [Mycoplasmatales bacterium]|nr:50S ribosomal protein L3 [Mycoplasmatales bacterium]